MKKSERITLEKQIVEVVNLLLAKYEPQPTKKVLKIVNEAAKGISKKLFRAARNKQGVGKENAKSTTQSRIRTKVKNN